MPQTAGIAYRHSQGGGADPGPPPLVLIHGAGGTSLHWPPQLRRLPGVEVFALDLPGHGDSPGSNPDTIAEKARSVVTWVEALASGPCVFAGHSMGGAIAQTLALDHRTHVAGLILVSTGGRLRVHPDILARSSSDEGLSTAVETILAWSYSDAADKRMVELAGERLSQIPAGVIHADYLACDRFDVLPRLAEIDCPVLVICGSEDQLTPLKYSHYLVDQIPGASLEIIHGAGHMVMLEQPEEVAKAVVAFYNKLKE